MFNDVLRDTTFGALVRLWRPNVFPYPEELPGYVLPLRYQQNPLQSATPSEKGLERESRAGTLVDALGICVALDETKAAGTESPPAIEEKIVREPSVDSSVTGSYRLDPFLVDFEVSGDVEDPYQWSTSKRYRATSYIMLLTFSVYIGSAIFTASIPGLVQETGISLVEGTLGLSLFILGYGTAPLILAPLQETPAIGRSPVYIIGLFAFVMFNLGAVFVENLPGLLILRLLAGAAGSPALATGGASMGDIWNARQVPYTIGLWSMAAVFGPTLGPVVGGFAAQALGYRWPIIELLILSAFALVVLFFFLPETFGPTILLNRAIRLRKVTGDPRYRAASEIKNEGKTIAQEVMHNFKYTLKLSAEPAILFANIYIGLIYSVFYLWFEAFPLVFTDIYNFNLGLSGLPFVGFIVSGAVTYVVYAAYQYYYLQPFLDRNPDTPIEKRLELALWAAPTIPISLIMFGWGSRPDVHWMLPVVGAALYLPSIFISFQTILLYVTSGYPGYEASILASNDFFRSTSASIFPLFGTIFFTKLGLGPACTLLAGVSVILIFALWALMIHGPKLRARSRYSSETNLPKEVAAAEKVL